MRFRFQSYDQIHDVELTGVLGQDGLLRANVDGQNYEFEVLDVQPGQLSLRFPARGGASTVIYWAVENSRLWVSQNGCTYRLEKPAPRRASSPLREGAAAAGEEVRAPMPAQVRGIQVAQGEAVERGQTLLLLEAMKMEIRIKSPANGRVARLLVSDGQAVEKDQVLVEIGE